MVQGERENSRASDYTRCGAADEKTLAEMAQAALTLPDLRLHLHLGF